MGDLFASVKDIHTSEVFRAFYPGVQLGRDGSGREKALCPFHDEKTPSLTIYENSFKCFGCNAGGSNIDLLLKNNLASLPLDAAKMIADKFGIPIEESNSRKQKPPTLAEYASYVNVPQGFLSKTFHPREKTESLEMPYLDETGKEVATRKRTKLGAKDGSRWPKGTVPILYGLWTLERIRAIGRVLLVEGESDVQVCWYNKVPALGVPGATNFKSEWASVLLPFPEIAIIQEPDKAGGGFAKDIVSKLRGANYQGQVKAVCLPEKDVRDLWLKHGEKFKELLETAITNTPPVDLYPQVPLTTDLILEVSGLLSRHIFFKDKRLPLLIATWILGTYVYDLFMFFGYLWINSPVKRCGKSLLQDILSQLCFQATSRFSNASESAIFRLAHTGRTLILDELENLRSQDKEKYGVVMSILNNGFQAGGKVPRTERGKEGFKVVEYSVFCPKVLAGINSLTDTIEDRSFKVSMVRKTKGERVERFNLRRQSKAIEHLRGELGLWAEARKQTIEQLYDGIEEVSQLNTLDDRFKDISEPLIAIGSYSDTEATNGQRRIMSDLISVLLDMAGRRSESEKQESIAAFIPVAEDVLTSGVSVFISSKELLAKVREVDELSWMETTRSLSSFLGKFDLNSRRDPRGAIRGYLITREWLEENKYRYSVYISGSEASEASESQSGSGSEVIL